MAVLPIEDETICNFNEEEELMIVYTSNKIWWKTFEQAGVQSLSNGGCGFKTYHVPKGWLTINVPLKKKVKVLMAKICGLEK